MGENSADTWIVDEHQEIENKFQVLQNSVKDSLEETKTQLGSITDFGSILISIVLAGITISTAIWLKILYYWIPASFLYIIFWIVIFGLVVMKSPLTIFEKDYLRKMNLEALKNGTAASYSMVVIYIISLIPLILIALKIINTNTNFSFIIPLIATSFTIILGAVSPDKSIKFTEGGMFQEYYKMYKASGAARNKNREMLESEELRDYKEVNRRVGSYFLFAVIIGIFLYVWAFIESLKLVTSIPYVLLFTVIALIISVLLQKHFSTQDAKRELSTTVENLSLINDQINRLRLNKNFKTGEYEKLKKLFLTARKYDIILVNPLKIVQTYHFHINKEYFENTYPKDEKLVV